MLLLCFTIMTSANIKETTVNGIFLYIKYIKKGRHAALTIEDSDTYLKTANSTKKIINKKCSKASSFPEEYSVYVEDNISEYDCILSSSRYRSGDKATLMLFDYDWSKTLNVASNFTIVSGWNNIIEKMLL